VVRNVPWPFPAAAFPENLVVIRDADIASTNGAGEGGRSGPKGATAAKGLPNGIHQ
jgi:hypothetical protein